MIRFFKNILFQTMPVPSKSHTHPIGPKPARGRPGPDWLRCVACGYSTRNKEVLACTLSDRPGGRLCTSCATRLPVGCPSDCVSWLGYLLNKQICHSCTKLTDEIVICVICQRYLCVSCVVPETYNLWGDLGIEGIVCNACCPDSVRKNPDGCDDFCFLCVDSHENYPVPPCQNPDTKEVPLISFLRDGKVRHDRAVSSNKPLSIRVPPTDTTLQSLRLPSGVLSSTLHSSGPGLVSLPPSRASLADFSTAIPIDPSLIVIDSASRSASPVPVAIPSNRSVSHASAPLISPNRFVNFVDESVPVPQVPFCSPQPSHPINQQSVGAMATGPSSAYKLSDSLSPLIEDRMSRLINQAILPLSQMATQNAASIEKVCSSLNRLSVKTSPASTSAEVELPNTIGIQCTPSILLEEETAVENSRPLDFGSMKELIQLQSENWAKEVAGLKSSISGLSSTVKSLEAAKNRLEANNRFNNKKNFNRNKKNNQGNNSQKKSD